MNLVKARNQWGLSLAAFIALSAKGQAAVITVASPSYDAVNAAVTVAVPGDTIRIPAGTANWSGKTLVTTKAISFSGAGPGLTILTNSGSSRFFLLSPASDKHIKISGIAFSHAYDGEEIPSIVLDRRCTALWIDNCVFRNSARSFTANATCYGLIRNTSFINCDTAVFIQNEASTDVEDGDAEWAAGYRLGTTNTMVVEDCSFIVNRSGSYDEQFYGQGASRYTVRRCWFSVSGSAIAPFCDAHGNWDIGIRGSHVYEFYDNAITNNSDTYFTFHFRGGLMMCFSNRVYASSSSATIFKFRNELLNTYSRFGAEDQLQNSYWFMNLLNGRPQTEWSALEDGGCYNWANSPEVVFSANEDAWVPPFMKAREWTASVAYIQASGSTPPSYRKHNGSLYRCIVSHMSSASTEPGVGASWRTVWVNDPWHVYLRPPQSDDPIYPYRPLVYPHPLVTAAGGGSIKPQPPTNIRIEPPPTVQAFNK